MSKTHAAHGARLLTGAISAGLTAGIVGGLAIAHSSVATHTTTTVSSSTASNPTAATAAASTGSGATAATPAAPAQTTSHGS